MTPVEFSAEYRAALAREAQAAAGDTNAPEALPQAIRALDAPPQPPLGWIVRDLWPAGKIGLFVGDGGAFKSSAALHIAAAIAGGYPVFERYRVDEARPVLIVSAEDELPVVLMRLTAFIVGHGWDLERVLGNIHIIADAEPSLGSAAWKLHLIAEVERIRPGFIILDPWADLLGGDENSNTDARPAIKFLRRLASVSDAGVAVVHHAGKQGSSKDEKRALDRIRGASALPSAARVILFFEWRPDGVYVENLKMSRAPKLESFLIRREIATDPDNNATWVTAKLTLAAALPFAEQWVIDRLRERKREPHPTTGDLRAMAEGVAGIRKQDLASAMSKLLARGITTYTEGARKARHWRLVDPNYKPPQLELVRDSGPKRVDPAHPAQTSGQGTRRDPAHSYAATTYAPGDVLTLPGQGENDPAHPAQSLLGRVARDPAPPKGGGQGVTAHKRTEKPGQGQGNGADPWADRDFTPSDLDAEMDERRGMQEG